jgi:ABC-type multidrug transport system permease subunit
LAVINSFPKERVLVLRERAAGTYRSSAYFLAKNLSEASFQLLAPVVFSSIVYFIIGLQADATKFFIFMGFLMLGTMAAISLALMISALARTTDLSVTILPMALELSRLFGGFFLAPINLPSYFSWLDALSYVKYVYMALAQNELNGLTLTCTAAQKVNGVCPVPNGEATIDKLGLDALSMGACAGILVAYILITRVIAYLGVRFIKH